ncbi:Wall-associated receptor kinase-like 8 [Bienertia sinuspersici]
MDRPKVTAGESYCSMGEILSSMDPGPPLPSSSPELSAEKSNNNLTGSGVKQSNFWSRGAHNLAKTGSLPELQMSQTHTGKMKNKRKKKFEEKEEYVIRNGGILLEKRIVFSQGKDIGAGQLKVFSSADTEKATNCYDPDFIELHVHSFRVLMLELLIRRKPLWMDRDGEALVDSFVSAVGKHCMIEMIDSKVMEGASKGTKL